MRWIVPWSVLLKPRGWRWSRPCAGRLKTWRRKCPRGLPLRRAPAPKAIGADFLDIEWLAYTVLTYAGYSQWLGKINDVHAKQRGERMDRAALRECLLEPRLCRAWWRHEVLEWKPRKRAPAKKK